MSFKVVKDQSGKVIAYGPNDDNYVPTVGEGCTLEIVDKPPPPLPATPLEQIRALEDAHDDDQRRLNRQTALTLALDKACLSSDMLGKTRAQVHAAYYAANAGYRRAFDLEQQIAQLRKLIP